MATPACPRCAQSVAPFGVQNGSCKFCRDLRSPLDRIVRLAPYEGLFADLVRAFKYRGREELDRFFGDSLADATQAAGVSEGVDALVAVPTCWQHEWRRRLYVPDLIARHVGARLEIRVLPLLSRRHGRHQVGLPASERPANVRGVFHVTPGAEVRDATLCVIDDVSTTGATLTECARVLRRAGAQRVYGAVLARATPDVPTQYLSDV